MKRLILVFAIPLLLILSSMSGCEKEEGEDPVPEQDMLHVEFTNDARSAFTITVLEMRPHGKAGEADSPAIGDWQSNVLPAGTSLTPGQTHIMDIPIQNLYWNEYRLGVLDENGVEIMLHEQDGYPEQTGPPITHWGGDNRQCYVYISRNVSNGLIYIQGWGDNAY